MQKNSETRFRKKKKLQLECKFYHFYKIKFAQEMGWNCAKWGVRWKFAQEMGGNCAKWAREQKGG